MVKGLLTTKLSLLKKYGMKVCATTIDTESDKISKRFSTLSPLILEASKWVP